MRSGRHRLCAALSLIFDLRKGDTETVCAVSLSLYSQILPDGFIWQSLWIKLKKLLFFFKCSSYQPHVNCTRCSSLRLRSSNRWQFTPGALSPSPRGISERDKNSFGFLLKPFPREYQQWGNSKAACLSLFRFREQQSIVCWCQRLCSFNPYLSRETRRSWRAFVQPRRASDTLEDFSNHKYVWQERAAHKSTDTRWLTVVFFLMPVSLKAGRSYITRGRLRPDARKSRCGGTKRESRSGMIFRHQSTISIYKY